MWFQDILRADESSVGSKCDGLLQERARRDRSYDLACVTVLERGNRRIESRDGKRTSRSREGISAVHQMSLDRHGEGRSFFLLGPGGGRRRAMLPAGG